MNLSKLPLLLRTRAVGTIGGALVGVGLIVTLAAWAGVRTADISRAADNGEIDAAGRRRQRRIKLESLNAWMARRAAKVERRRRKATARASSTPTVPAAAA